MSSRIKKLQYAIENKVRVIEAYKTHRDKDDLSEWGKEEYSRMIKKLEKDIEDIKEEYRVEKYRATETLKYSKDDVDLRLDEVEKEIDMSDESKTYRDDIGGYPESSELERDTPDEEVRSAFKSDMYDEHDAYSVRKDYRELFGRDESYEITDISDWDDMAQAMNDMGVAIDIPEKEPELIIDDSVIGKLKASVEVPEEFKFADNMTFYTMLRNIFRGKNILVTGPSGCGKSSLGKILAEITNKPFYSFNFGGCYTPLVYRIKPRLTYIISII